MSGVVLHGLLVGQLLRAGLHEQAPIAVATEPQKVLWTLLWGLLGGLLGFRVRSPLRASLAAAGGLVILASAGFLAFVEGWWIPTVPPAIGWLTAAAAATAYMSNEESRQRARLMQLFSAHVSKEVAEVIWQQRDQFLEGGRPRPQALVATVLFMDFKGFTAVSEKMDPKGLMDWLNTYLDAMANLVVKHGGVIDDYAGDAIKADFGVPVPRLSEAEIARDAVNAVACALSMEEEMLKLNRLHEEQHLATIGMRIGIYTGSVVAGTVGSSQRLKYTTVGDTVNIAARLESLDRDVADAIPGRSFCRILVGESTVRYLKNQFQTERVGAVSLKGKDHKIEVFRVLGGLDRNSGGA
jgi:adenylate cyclase